MRRSRFTETQIVTALCEADEGTPVEQICRKLGIRTATFYVWRKDYAGLDASEVQKLHALQIENRRLKRLLNALSEDAKILASLAAESTAREHR